MHIALHATNWSSTFAIKNKHQMELPSSLYCGIFNHASLPMQ